jgi:hypothetical protein
MKQLLYFSLLFFISFSQKAQTADSGKVIGIHPIVGKTISLDEKIKYNLFPEYNDSLFSSAQFIRNSDSTYTIVFTSISGTELKKNISSNEMNDLFYKIDKIEYPDKYCDYVSAENPKRYNRFDWRGVEAISEILVGILQLAVLFSR